MSRIFETEKDKNERLMKLVELYENYDVYKSDLEDIRLTHDILYILNDKNLNRMMKIDPFSIHDDNEDSELPLFCIRMRNGVLITCYSPFDYSKECEMKDVGI